MSRLLLALLFCAPLAAQQGPRERFERAAIDALSRGDPAQLEELLARTPWHAEALVFGLLRQSLAEGPDAWTVDAAARVARAHDALTGVERLGLDVARRRAYDDAALAERRAIEVERGAAHEAAAERAFERGAASARRAAARARALGHAGLEAELLRLLAQLLLDENAHDGARQALEDARALDAARGATLALARDEHLLAIAALRGGRLSAALMHHEASLAQLAPTDVPPLVAPLDLGGLYAWLGRHAEARPWLARALADAPTAAVRARVRMQLGSLESAQGRYGPALRELAAAVDAAESTDAGRLVSEAHALHAAVLSEVGRTADAERALDAASTALLGEDAPVERANIDLARGLVHVDAGAPELALAPLARARSAFESFGDAAGAARARQQEARALTALGWDDEARAVWSDAARRAVELGDPLQAALAWTGLGGTYESLGDALLAAGAYERALVAAVDVDTPEARWRARAGLARLLVQDAPDVALCSFAAAAADLEDIRSALEAPALRLRFLEDKLAIFRGAARLAAGLGRAEEAFRWSEAAKARTLRERHAARDADAASEVLAPLFEAERALAALELAASAARRAGIDAATRADLDARLFTAHRARERARLAAELARPGLPHAALELAGRGRPTSPAAVAAALPDDAALVAYVLDAAGCLALVVRAEGLQVRALDVTSMRVAELTRMLAAPVAALRGGATDLANLGFDARAAEELYARLVAPLEDLVTGCDMLLVVPDGALWHAPLAALVRRRVAARVDPRRLYAQHAAHEYLVDRYAVCVLPSAALLTARPAPPLSSGPGETALLVADPAPLPDGAPRLAAAARESRDVAARLPGATLLTGEAAGEAAVDAALEGASWLHFAVHARYDAAHPASSRLALAPQGGDDGWLHAFEIEQRALVARHVVLSACESAGPTVAGEGFLGLARAFLVAGVPSLVATHWVVDDEAAAAFMREYYTALGAGARPVRALRAAQRAQRRAGTERVRYAHPFFWAGYVLIGAP